MTRACRACRRCARAPGRELGHRHSIGANGASAIVVWSPTPRSSAVDDRGPRREVDRGAGVDHRLRQLVVSASERPRKTTAIARRSSARGDAARDVALDEHAISPGVLGAVALALDQLDCSQTAIRADRRRAGRRRSALRARGRPSRRLANSPRGAAGRRPARARSRRRTRASDPSRASSDRSSGPSQQQQVVRAECGAQVGDRVDLLQAAWKPRDRCGGRRSCRSREVDEGEASPPSRPARSCARGRRVRARGMRVVDVLPAKMSLILPRRSRARRARMRERWLAGGSSEKCGGWACGG